MLLNPMAPIVFFKREAYKEKKIIIPAVVTENQFAT